MFVDPLSVKIPFLSVQILDDLALAIECVTGFYFIGHTFNCTQVGDRNG